MLPSPLSLPPSRGPESQRAGLPACLGPPHQVTTPLGLFFLIQNILFPLNMMA